MLERTGALRRWLLEVISHILNSFDKLMPNRPISDTQHNFVYITDFSQGVTNPGLKDQHQEGQAFASTNEQSFEDQGQRLECREQE